MDMQFIFAFEQPPASLQGLVGLSDLLPTDPRLAAFERSLSVAKGTYAYATTELRTLKP
jgi:hypothetical protein